MMAFERSVLLGVSDADLARKLAAEVLRCGKPCQVHTAASLAELYSHLARRPPVVILLDETTLNGAQPETVVRQLTESAPVIVLGGPELRAGLARQVAAGEIEFVGRVGDFLPVAAGFVERRLRWADRTVNLLEPPLAELPSDFAELLRHEINNPLTGILGNAELLLAHRERLPASSIQRLETIVDLSVRLRETIRRLTNSWESQHQAQLRES